MSDSNQSRKINRFFAEFIAKLRKWLNKIGSPIRISRRFVRQLLGATKGQRKGGAAGFVLPTVTLVTLVVTLLVVTTVSRSSERAQTAANTRTEQVFRSAATPIVDRARAKIDALLNDGKLPRTTPPELTLDSVITSDSGKYTLPDETRLQLVYNFTPSAGINYTNGQIENREYVSSAWKFPIDTDNNGKFDSYGLYSILFRARPPSVTTRPVVPIESRALPMDETTLSGSCVSTGGVTNIAGDGGWTNSSDNKLRKSFFVYAVTVPIKDAASFPASAALAPFYEVYNGLNAISAVELQQDRARSPQNNNAVFFEGDTELVNTATFRLNGRLYSAGNLMVGAGTDRPITLFQVSSSGGSTTNTATTNPDLFGSCYYEKKNSEIIVAGNVVEGDTVTDKPADLSTSTLGKVNIHLFRGSGVPPVASVSGRTGIIELNETNQSVNSATAGNLSSDLALNDFAYNNRIGALVDAAILLRGQATVNFPLPANFSTTNLIYAGLRDPISVQTDLVNRIKDEALSSQTEVNAARRLAYTAYFGERTRKVSFREVGFGAADPLLTPLPVPLTAIPGSDVTQPPELVPPISMMLPMYANANFGKAIGSFSLATGAGFDGKGAIFDATGITLLQTANRLNMSSSDPNAVIAANNNEKMIGDRILVGNGLPAKWLKMNTTNNILEFIGEKQANQITTNSSVFWNDPNETTAGTVERNRETRSIPLSNLGVSDRGGFWEISAALDPAVSDPLNPTTLTPESSPRTGGLRVVTNAGIYSRRPEDTFLTRFRTGLVDDPATPNFDESSAPLWNGQVNNPITDFTDANDPNHKVDELKFAATYNSTVDARPDRELTPRNYVVWPDSMPMTPEPTIRLLDSTTVPPRAIAGNYARSYASADGWSTVITAQLPDTRKSDLQMRATAVYHYKYDAFNAISSPNNYQSPIACVSSYYDPSTFTTAKNGSVPSGAATVNAPWNFNASGRSNNGLVYNVGRTAASTTADVTFTGIRYDAASGLFYDSAATGSNPAGGIFKFKDPAREPSNAASPYAERLAYQANLIFPNGRFANEPLREVLKKIIVDRAVTTGAAAGLTLPQQSTLDSNLCALQILDRTLTLANTNATAAAITPTAIAGNTPLTSVLLPHGAFRESSFLDAREVKALNRNESLTEAANGNNSAATGGLSISSANRGDIYDLEIEQRQPLEIRTTDIDIDRLRGATIAGGNNSGVATDFMLPYSGIVYASREDALEDLSYYDTVGGIPVATSLERRKNLSSTDFLLDPTRRPTSIRLINGYRLWRSSLNTANLPNVDGTALVSNATYAGFPWTEATKGEKGLTLVSNLPVYVKAQNDPVPASINPPSFNRHTREEFTQLLNENVATPTLIWDNFYQRHANNGLADKLDSNFACRPSANVNCTLGDEWRPATVLADAVTVLSANFRDGYRSDGDFDIRNNAHTSTSINWQSQLNTNAEKLKDSSYVTDLRRNGFFNNSFVTSSQWLRTINSDGGAGANTSTWMGDPDAAVPVNGNLASYNANGVTPVQRRIPFSEYGMEICRKVPSSECTFSDWVKDGAGTTTLPTFDAAGIITTPAPTIAVASGGAPRYVAPDDWRYARRPSFLRFDDLYKDGNEQLIFAGSCPGSNQTWPMVIGVKNGNLATGYTYPMVMGGLGSPFDLNSKNSYGTVSCPDSGMTVEIVVDVSQAEGRRRNQNTLGSLEAQQGGVTTLPAVVWGTGNDLTGSGSVTNSDDNNSGGTAGAEGGSKSTNNAVYRRFNFTVRLNNPSLLAAGQTVRAKVTLFPRAAATTYNTYPGAVGSAFPLIGDGNTNTKTDYLNGLYNPNPAFTMTTVPGTVSVPVNGLYPRLGSGANSPEATNPEVATCPDATTNPLDPQYCAIISWTGPVTVAPSVPGPDSTNVANLNIRNLSVLVVRDSANESNGTNEEFRISLDNLKGPNVNYLAGPATPGAISSATASNRSLAAGLIVQSNPNTPPTPVCASGISTTWNNNDDAPRTRTAAATCPTPTPTPTPTPPTPTPTPTPPTPTPTPTPPTPTPTPTGGPFTMYPRVYLQDYLPKLPSSARSIRMPFSAIAPPAAAYPFYHKTGDTTTRNFNPPSAGGTAIERYIWQGTQFPDIPPRSAAAGETPMLPGNLTTTSTSSDQMSNSLPDAPNGTLWYKTASSIGNWLGEANNISYATNNLFINNLSFPAIRSGAGKANLNTTGRLLLPDTVCIDSTNGAVDNGCTRKIYAYNTSAPTDASTTLLNLNLPYNPHFPSDNISSQGASGVTPASTFAICGGVGNSLAYQSIDKQLYLANGSTGPNQRDITSGSCPTGANTAGAAIANFMGTAPAGAFPSLSLGTGLRSANLVPNNTTAGVITFVGLNPDYSKKSDGTGTFDLGNGVVPNTSSIDIGLRAKNTYANNRVHVFNLKNLVYGSDLTVSPVTDTGKNIGTFATGTRTLAGKITFRANCVDPITGADSTCTPTSIRRGPSPVFIMMADSAEDVVFSGLRVNLDGVDPNNIFWVFPKVAVGSAPNLNFVGGSVANTNVITGNFIGTMPNAASTVDNTTELAVTGEFSSFRGVRFLGFRTTDATIDDSTLFTAMTEVDQPGLLPVLQLHSPNATSSGSIAQPAAGTSGINGTPGTNAGQWTIRPVRTEVNVYFVAGTTPSRKGMSYTVSSTIESTAGVPAGTALPTVAVPTGETGGGLANFVRFLENWQSVPMKIAGGFIQNTKSRFATAPFAATRPFAGTSSDMKTVFMNPALPASTGLSGYKLYYQSATGDQLPYYFPPFRLWGYDVGLLTQQPDRFAERFAVPIAGSNEFYREISGDDPWVETLLCALEPNDPTAITAAGAGAVNVGRAQREGTTPTNYTKRALRGSDRRSRCDSALYGATVFSDNPAPAYE